MKQKIIDFLTRVLFISASIVIRIVTGIRDLFSRKKEVLPMAFICQVQYPTQFPAAEAGQLIKYFRGEGVELGCAACCAWNVQGYAMSFIPHEHPPIIGTESFEILPDEKVADKLEEFCQTANAVQFQAEAGAIPPWLVPFLPLIADVVKRLLDRWLK